MTGAMVIVQNGTPLQPLTAMLIQMIFLLVVLKLAPYNNDLDDWSSFVCSLALTLTTLAGFLLMISNKDLLDPVLSAGLLTALLIGINALCFVYEIVVIGYVVCQEKCVKRKKNENSADTELKTKKSKNKNKVQVLPIEDKKSNNEATSNQINEENAAKAWEVTDVVTNGNQQRDFEQNAAKAWGKTINE